MRLTLVAFGVWVIHIIHKAIMDPGYPRYIVTAIGVWALDRISKTLVINNFSLYESRPLLDGVIWLTYVHNRGAAFGIMPGKSWLFLLLAIVMVVGVIVYIMRYQVTPAVKLSLSLLVGGALGNFFDRLRWGYVIDFIDLHWWPVFNIADMAIVIGGLLLAFSLTSRKNNEEIQA